VRKKMKKPVFVFYFILIAFVSSSLSQACRAQQICAEIFAKSSISTGNITPDQLFVSFDRIIREQPQEIVLSMMRDSAIQDIRAGKTSFLNVYSNEYPSEKMVVILQNSQQMPQLLPGSNSIKYGFGPGTALYKNRLFVNSYFAQHGVHHPLTTSELTTGQPYFIWSDLSKVFEFKSDGAQNEILKVFSQGHKSTDKISIFRGIPQPAEKRLITVILKTAKSTVLANKDRVELATQLDLAVDQWSNFGTNPPTQLNSELKAKFIKMRQTLLNEEWSIETQKRLSDDLSDLFIESNRFFGRDAIFTTPDADTAKQWGRFGILEAQIPLQTITNFSDSKDIYIGIEGGIEIAFISQLAQRILLQSGFFQ
jgi:hypothetical protein